MSIYRNAEGYPDPTAGAAISNLTRKERSERRKQQRKKNAALKKQLVSKTVESDEKNRTGPISGAG